MAETDLYLPLKAFMEAAGYSVKGEVNGCDLVGVTETDPPVVVVCEMKLAFNLELVMQAVQRAAFCDEVWLAARASRTGRGREADARFRNLCRRLGFGMLTVSASGAVEVVVGPPVDGAATETAIQHANEDYHPRRRLTRVPTSQRTFTLAKSM